MLAISVARFFLAVSRFNCWCCFESLIVEFDRLHWRLGLICTPEVDDSSRVWFHITFESLIVEFDRLHWHLGFLLLKLMTRAGFDFRSLLNFVLPSDVILQEWQDPSKVMRAFRIGKLESQAVCNLVQHVPKETLDTLWDAVRQRGMRLLTHECIAKDLFSVSYSSATGNWEAWKAECVNKHDDHTVVPWLRGNMCKFVADSGWLRGPCFCEIKISALAGFDVLGSNESWLGPNASEEGLELQRSAVAPCLLWGFPLPDRRSEVAAPGTRLSEQWRQTLWAIRVWVLGCGASVSPGVISSTHSAEHSPVPQDWDPYLYSNAMFAFLFFWCFLQAKKQTQTRNTRVQDVFTFYQASGAFSGAASAAWVGRAGPGVAVKGCSSYLWSPGDSDRARFIDPPIPASDKREGSRRVIAWCKVPARSAKATWCIHSCSYFEFFLCRVSFWFWHLSRLLLQHFAMRCTWIKILSHISDPWVPRTGQEWCHEFMEQKCKLTTVDSSITSALSTFGRFTSAINHSISGRLQLGFQTLKVQAWYGF